jgi:ubiquinone/menaquinone biosynthesis C-methylase UbiE
MTEKNSEILTDRVAGLANLIDIGAGESFRDDWNERATVVGADAIASFGPKSVDMFGEYYSFVVSHRIRSLAQLNSRDRVLDLGCGPGKIAYWIAPEVHSIVGVDVSDVMLTHAARRCAERKNVTFKCNSGLDLSILETESLDAVYSLACFIHLPIDVQQAYEKEIVRVLRPGGAALVHVRHNQKVEKVKRTYTGANYDQSRVDQILKIPNVAAAELRPIERFDDLVANLDHRRWLVIRKR